MRRSLLIPPIVAVALLCLAFVLNRQAPPKSWGFYQILWSAQAFESGILSQIERLGAHPDFVLFFRDLSPKRGFPRTAVEICHQYGATPVISQELWQWGKRHENKSDWLDRINAGEFDAYWRAWAVAAKELKVPVILRFGFEMNGDWFAWGQQPKAFIAAWQRVYRIVRIEHGADEVLFMFSPNVEWATDDEEIGIELYYPGDAYVDLLGLDGYNFGDEHSEWHRWQSYRAIFGDSIEKMSQWDKPLILSEIGCAQGPLKAEWIRDFLDDVGKDRRVSGFIYYNHHDPRKKEPNWLLDSDPHSRQIFSAFIQKQAEANTRK